MVILNWIYYNNSLKEGDMMNMHENAFAKALMTRAVREQMMGLSSIIVGDFCIYFYKTLKMEVSQVLFKMQDPDKPRCYDSLRFSGDDSETYCVAMNRGSGDTYAGKGMSELVCDGKKLIFEPVPEGVALTAESARHVRLVALVQPVHEVSC